MPYKTEMLHEKIRITPSPSVESEDKQGARGKASDVIVQITVHSNGEQSKKIEVENLSVFEVYLKSADLSTEKLREEYILRVSECQHILTQLKEIISEKIPNK